MKKLLLVMVFVILFIVAACGGDANLGTPSAEDFSIEEISSIEPEPTSEPTPEPTPVLEEISALTVGESYEFASYTWRVLDIYENYALIITQDIIMRHAYHDTHEHVTWETSDIRQFLNTEFYDSFSVEERARIRETEVINADNQWYGTPGGNDTTDKIFLLSLEEVVNYFGDGGALQNRPNLTLSDVGRQHYYYDYADHDWLASDPLIWWIYDRFNNARRARYNGEFDWWWLRSPGYDSYCAANIYIYGFIFVSGGFVTADWPYAGVRPAMWVSLDSRELT